MRTTSMWMALGLLAGSPSLITAQPVRTDSPPSPIRIEVPTDIAASEGTGAPTWAVEGVPTAVWTLVEAAAATPDRNEAKRLLIDAEIEARRAVEAAPGDTGRRFGLAVVLGSRADIEGGRTKVRAASALHVELEALLALDPEHARARHMLGRLHAGVKRMNRVVRWIATRLLGGDVLAHASWEEAELHLAFAEDHDPGILEHHMQLARLYDDTDRPRLALQEIDHILAREPGSAIDRAVVEEATALRAELVARSEQRGAS